MIRHLACAPKKSGCWEEVGGARGGIDEARLAMHCKLERLGERLVEIHYSVSSDFYFYVHVSIIKSNKSKQSPKIGKENARPRKSTKPKTTAQCTDLIACPNSPGVRCMAWGPGSRGECRHHRMWGTGGRSELTGPGKPRVVRGLSPALCHFSPSAEASAYVVSVDRVQAKFLDSNTLSSLRTSSERHPGLPWDPSKFLF